MKKCPRCNKELEKNTIRGVNVSVEVETCAGCGGTWFEKSELACVDKVVEPVVFEIRKLPSMDQQLKALNCPACTPPVIMSKAYHNRDNKVIMDYCPHCKGIWLDKGELEAIQKENWLITLKNVYRWIIREEDSL